MADGKITFDTALDNRQLEKELEAVQKKIAKATEARDTAEAKRLPLLDQAKELGARLDEAKAKLAELRGLGDRTEISTQKEEVSALQKEYNAINNQIDRYAETIKESNIAIDEGKEKAEALQEEMKKSNSGIRDIAKAGAETAKEWEQRIISIAKRVFVFQMITKVLRAAREYMGGLLEQNAEYQAELARLRGALATAFQPLYEVAVPILIKVLQILTTIASVAANVIAFIFGKTAAQSAQNAKALNQEKKAIQGTGKAAEKASKQLAGFDELNVLSENAEESAGGLGGVADGLGKIDFSEIGQFEMTDKLRDILEMVGLIAAGFALWKVGEMLPGMLGTILTQVGGILIALGGIALAIYGITDAWNNGVSWENMLEIMGGVALAAFGLNIAFGKTAAGIALLVGGLAMAIVGFKDAFTNGMNLKNMLLIVAGIFATGLGIALITGSLLPALIAGFAAALVALAYFTGNGNDLIKGLKQVMEGFITFVKAVFAGDWAKAWEGMKTATKGAINVLISLLNSLISATTAAINAVFRALSFNIDLPGGKTIGINLPQINASGWKIPLLAQGAVIPPNAPFMAMLGDQRSGNNIEAPEDLIRQIVREEAGGGYDEEVANLLRELISAVAGIRVGDDVIGRAATRYQNNRAKALGGR